MDIKTNIKSRSPHHPCYKHNIQNMLLEEEKQSEKSGSHFFFHFEKKIKMRRQ